MADSLGTAGRAAARQDARGLLQHPLGHYLSGRLRSLVSGGIGGRPPLGPDLGQIGSIKAKRRVHLREERLPPRTRLAHRMAEAGKAGP